MFFKEIIMQLCTPLKKTTIDTERNSVFNFHKI